MNRFTLPLVVALVAGAATLAAPAAQRAPAKLPPAGVARAPVTPAPVTAQSAQVGWLDRYGSYNVRQGSWTFIPGPNGC